MIRPVNVISTSGTTAFSWAGRFSSREGDFMAENRNDKPLAARRASEGCRRLPFAELSQEEGGLGGGGCCSLDWKFCQEPASVLSKRGTCAALRNTRATTTALG